MQTTTKTKTKLETGRWSLVSASLLAVILWASEAPAVSYGSGSFEVVHDVALTPLIGGGAKSGLAYDTVDQEVWTTNQSDPSNARIFRMGVDGTLLDSWDHGPPIGELHYDAGTGNLIVETWDGLGFPDPAATDLVTMSTDGSTVFSSTRLCDPGVAGCFTTLLLDDAGGFWGDHRAPSPDQGIATLVDPSLSVVSAFDPRPITSASAIRDIAFSSDGDLLVLMNTPEIWEFSAAGLLQGRLSLEPLSYNSLSTDPVSGRIVLHSGDRLITIDTVAFEAIPEPGGAVLVGIGLAGLAHHRRRLRRSGRA